MDPNTVSGTKQVSIRLKLTSRLVSHEAMKLALEELEAKFTRYTVLVRRSAWSAEAVEADAMNLVIFDEPLVPDGEIDQRLLKSKSVILTGSVKDGGTAVINLTTRRIQPQFGSPDLKQALDSFNAQLTKGARSRWFNTATIAALVYVPLLAILGTLGIDEAINPHVYKAMNSDSASGRSYQAVPFDHWVGRVNLTIAVFWAFLIVGAIILGAIRIWAAPLGIWPEKMTSKSFVLTVHRLRVSSATRKNATTIVLSVIAGVLIALFSRAL
jgi:hypothetical protein